MTSKSAFWVLCGLWMGGAATSTIIFSGQLAAHTFDLATPAVSVLLSAQFVIPIWMVTEKLALIQRLEGQVNMQAFVLCLALSLVYVIWIAGCLWIQDFGSPARIDDTELRRLLSSPSIQVGTRKALEDIFWRLSVENIFHEKAEHLCEYMPLLPALLLAPIIKLLGLLFPSEL